MPQGGHLLRCSGSRRHRGRLPNRHSEGLVQCAECVRRSGEDRLECRKTSSILFLYPDGTNAAPSIRCFGYRGTGRVTAPHPATSAPIQRGGAQVRAGPHVFASALLAEVCGWLEPTGLGAPPPSSPRSALPRREPSMNGSWSEDAGAATKQELSVLSLSGEQVVQSQKPFTVETGERVMAMRNEIRGGKRPSGRVLSSRTQASSTHRAGSHRSPSPASSRPHSRRAPHPHAPFTVLHYNPRIPQRILVVSMIV